jgi:two-component system chemotaxis response regulator CheB
MPTTRDIVVIGASAGGIEAVQSLMRALPPDLPAALFLVIHIPTVGVSALARILGRASRLPVETAQDGAPIRPGVLSVAPPNRHLLVRAGAMAVVHEPDEHRQRPAIDPLFRSAAQAYGPRVVGIVLSGMLDDGTDGLIDIKTAGGLAIVQHPDEAAFSSMPRSAMAATDVDYCLPIAEIAELLPRLVREPVAERAAALPNGDAIGGPDAVLVGDAPAKPAGLSCPDCGGALWEQERKGHVRFRCRIGHAFSAASLAEAQTHEIDDALWTAIRAIEEKGALVGRVMERAKATQQPAIAERLRRRVRRLENQALVLRRLIGAQKRVAHV